MLTLIKVEIRVKLIVLRRIQNLTSHFKCVCANLVKISLYFWLTMCRELQYI